MSRIFIPFIFDAFTDQTPNLSLNQSIQIRSIHQCKKEHSYAGWSGHCRTHHAPKDDDGDVLLADDDKNGDDGSQSKKRPVQPKAKAATQKTVCKGKRPAAKTKAKK